MILKSTSDYRSFLNPDGSVTLSVRANDRIHSVRAELEMHTEVSDTSGRRFHVETSGKVFGDFESKFQIVSLSNPLPRPTDLLDFIPFLTTLDAHLISHAEMDFEAFVETYWLGAYE